MEKETIIRGIIAVGGIIAGVIADQRMQGARIDKLDLHMESLIKTVGKLERSIERMEKNQ